MIYLRREKACLRYGNLVSNGTLSLHYHWMIDTIEFAEMYY